MVTRHSGRRPSISNVSNMVDLTFCTALLSNCVPSQHSDSSRVNVRREPCVRFRMNGSSLGRRAKLRAARSDAGRTVLITECDQVCSREEQLFERSGEAIASDVPIDPTKVL